MEQVEHHLVLQHVQEEQSIVQQEHQLVVQYQMDTILQDVMDLEIIVQDKVSAQLETIVQMEYLMLVVAENIVEQEQRDAQIYLQDVMEQVQVVHVLIPAQEERNIVEQEHQVVVQYQMDTILLDAMALEINVQVKLSALLEHLVQMVCHQLVQEEQSIVQREQQVVVLYQADTIQQDAMDLETIVQVKLSALLEHLVQMVCHQLAQEEQNIVGQEHQVVVQYQADTIQQAAIVQIITVQDKASVLQVTTV